MRFLAQTWFLKMSRVLAHFLLRHQYQKRIDLWMNRSKGHCTSFLERIKILHHHRGEKVIVLDTFMCLLAELPPQISVLNELERTLCTRFCLIRNITVLTVDDLCS